MYLTKHDTWETRREYALRTIKENIVCLNLEPGSMVSENELSQELGISRGPVREALLELSRMKIVEVYPQRGSCVALIDYNLIDQVSFLRQTMECAVVERCCQSGIKPEYLSLLRENVWLQERYLENGHKDKLMKLDDEFHMYLFANSNAKDIHSLMSGLMIHFDRVRLMSLAVGSDREIVKTHSDILDAIVARNQESAIQLMSKHITHYKIDKETISLKYPHYVRNRSGSESGEQRERLKGLDISL